MSNCTLLSQVFIIVHMYSMCICIVCAFVQYVHLYSMCICTVCTSTVCTCSHLCLCFQRVCLVLLPSSERRLKECLSCLRNTGEGSTTSQPQSYSTTVVRSAHTSCASYTQQQWCVLHTHHVLVILNNSGAFCTHIMC